MVYFTQPFPPHQSLPVRGAWIEIIRLKFVYKYQNVAPRKGSVD